MVGVLRVVEGDRAVSERSVEQREQPGVLLEAVAEAYCRPDRRSGSRRSRSARRPRTCRSPSGRRCGWCCSASPRDWTSLKSAAYWALVSAGGAGGRNWLALSSTNGVTWDVWVNPAGANAGGVSWYSPGPVPGVNTGGVAVGPVVRPGGQDGLAPRARRNECPVPRARPTRSGLGTTGRTRRWSAAGWVAAHRARCAPRPLRQHRRDALRGPWMSTTNGSPAPENPVHRVVHGDLGDRQRAGRVDRGGLGARRDETFCSSWFHWITWSGWCPTRDGHAQPRAVPGIASAGDGRRREAREHRQRCGEEGKAFDHKSPIVRGRNRLLRTITLRTVVGNLDR